ncbi:alpha-ketoglutarate-dependent taurine dioxygenase [Bombardia bombarda]|uniref:Alpha-ketoglutarate-dependent taurine dioxygenase n=1 Tax=Bombardia bombarda TaxID=252184 RepID=A0AA39U2G1_9PEZI|nr:alpha-ketoglutarate-dependent taurine dioxygenase [Bombardia bombarda]
MAPHAEDAVTLTESSVIVPVPVAASKLQSVVTETEVKPGEKKAEVKDPNDAYAALFANKIDIDAESGKKGHAAAKYPHYLPTWDHSQKYAPLEPFTHVDPGHAADTTYPDLLQPAGVQSSLLTPTIGTEIRGIQLTSLTDAGKSQLAHLVASRKVVVVHDQDFADLSIPEALEYGKFFGPLHIHPTTGAPEGHPEVHIVHRGAGDDGVDRFFANRTSTVAWHSDVSYERQPPAVTFLYVLEKPETGGDTLFVDGVEAYNRLSPAFQERLHGLKAVHSGVEQAGASTSRGGLLRREPVRTEHPIVRTHPVTGEKALFVNPVFTREIVGLKKEESDVILKFLYEHLAYGADFQVRVRWGQGTVVLWDNRVTQHSAVVDWRSGERRHLARITPQGEKPFETPFAA